MSNSLGFLYKIPWLPGEQEERYGGGDGDGEDVVHPDVVLVGGEEYEEEDDGDGVEGGGQKSSHYSLKCCLKVVLTRI